MTPGFDRWIPASRDATADHDARSLADVAAWESRRPAREHMSPWWWVAIGAVLVVWVIGVAAVARVVWEWVG